MSYYRNLLHIVWSTKYRNPDLANEKLRKELFIHIMEASQVKNIAMIEVGGMSDHIHCLLSLSADSRLADVVRLIKAEAKYWYNSRPIINPLEWQDGYFAVSVSPKNEESVRQYIRKQEEHHSNRTYEQEYKEFIRMANIEKP